MTIEDQNDLLYLQIPLEEMQKLYERQISGIDAIKTNVRAVLSAASLIVSLVSAMQLVTVKIVTNWLSIFQATVIVTIVLYIGLIIMCIVALWPVAIIGPIKSEWDILTSSYKGLSIKEALSLRLSSTLNAIDQNIPIINRLKYLQMGVQVLLALIVTLTLFMALIPRTL